MLADLLAQPGVVEEVELRSTFGFMAFHGGSLERMTERVARDAAARSGASLYAVVQPPDFRWHVPSTAFDPAAWAPLARFVDHVDVVVAVHGYGRDGLFTTLLAGGQNRALATFVGSHLRDHLPEYDVVDDLDAIPRALRGVDARNPVNRVRRRGVQLELPPRVRGMGPFWSDHPHRLGPGETATRDGGLVPHTEALIEGLVASAAAWPAEASR